MKLYTKKGDFGTTYCTKYLDYIPKNHPFIEFVGSLDEAEAALGLASSLVPSELSKIREELDWIQNLLFRIGFTISGKRCVSENDLKILEKIADEYSIYASPAFKLNGGHPASAAISLARTLVRKVERRLVDLVEKKEIITDEKLLMTLLNRASSSLYALQLAVNSLLKVELKDARCEP